VLGALARACHQHKQQTSVSHVRGVEFRWFCCFLCAPKWCVCILQIRGFAIFVKVVCDPSRVLAIFANPRARARARVHAHAHTHTWRPGPGNKRGDPYPATQVATGQWRPGRGNKSGDPDPATNVATRTVATMTRQQKWRPGPWVNNLTLG
jgi:hypothetical protein